MRLPRNLCGRDLAGRFARHYGYAVTRMSGNYMTVTQITISGKHSVTAPAHRSLRVGTLNAIVKEVAEASGLSRRAIRATLFG